VTPSDASSQNLREDYGTGNVQQNVSPISVPSKPKKLSTKLLALLVIVFILGVALGGASTHSGTTTETETIQTTYTLPIMVTPEANVTEYKAAMSPILSEFVSIANQSEANFRAFSNGQMSRNDLISFLSQQKDSLKSLTEQALRLHPPPVFAEVHVHVVDALSLCYSAFTLYEDGLIQNNSSLIKEGTSFVYEATDELNTATSILNSST
jgi:hypothetical protein